MMTEKIQRAQPLMERDAVYPTGPVFDDDGDVIIRSENSYEEAASDAHEVATTEVEVTREGRVDEGTAVELTALDSWIEFKVRNELVAQIFKSEVDDGLVNIADVATIITTEFEAERKKHEMNVARIRTTVIPRAELRTEPIFNDSTAYWTKDIDNLVIRADIHQDMIGYIEGIQATGEDGLYSLAEEYISRTVTEARDEALAILLTQKQSLEAAKQVDNERIAALQETIHILEVELAAANQQIQERDTALLDSEAEAYLRRDANIFAA